MLINYLFQRKKEIVIMLLVALSLVIGTISSLSPIILLGLVGSFVGISLVILKPVLAYFAVIFLYTVSFLFNSPVIKFNISFASLPSTFVEILIIFLFIFIMGPYLLKGDNNKQRYKCLLSLTLIWLIVLLYYCLTLLWSSNTAMGLLYLRRMIIPFSILILSSYIFTIINSEYNQMYYTIGLVVGFQFFISVYEYVNMLPVYGTFFHNANYTMYLVPFLLLSLWKISQDKRMGIIDILFFLFAFIPFIYAEQRTAWLAFLVGSILLVISNKKMFFNYVTFGILILILASNKIFEAFSQINNAGSDGWYDTGNSVGWRFNVWSQMIIECFKSPYFGHGLGSSNDFVGSIYSQTAFAPHNEFIRLFYETGIFGLFLYLFALISPILVLVKSSLRRKGESKKFNYRLLMISCILAFLVCMIPDNIITYSEVTALYFTLIGMLFGLELRVKTRNF